MIDALDAEAAEARLLAESMTIGAALHGAPVSIDSAGIRFSSGWTFGYARSPATGAWFLSILSRSRSDLYAPIEAPC